MSMFDINKVWDSGSEKARKHYESVRDDVENMAKRKSESVLRKIHHKFIIEMIASIIIVVLLGAVLYSKSSMVFGWYSGFVALAFVVSLKLYFNLRRDILRVNEKEVVRSLEEYIRIINLYLKKNKIFVYIATPAGFLLGFVTALVDEGFDITLESLLIALGAIVVIGVPVVWLMIWLANKKYYKLMYQKHVNELEDILANLKNDLKDPQD